MKNLKSILAAALATFTFTVYAGDNGMDPGPDDSTLVVQSTPDDPGDSDPTREPPVSVEENNIQGLKLYPNPAVGSEFTMDLPLSDSEPIALFIYDMNGRIVDRKSGSYAELRHFRFRHLDEAAYIVKVFSQNILFQSRVLVVHR